MSPSTDSTALTELLLDAGVAVRIVSARELVLTPPSGSRTPVRLVPLTRPPTSSEMRDRALGAPDGIAIGFVTPRSNSISRRLALEDPRLAVFGVDDGTVIVAGKDLTVEKADLAAHRPGRVSYGRFALYRTLARTRAPRSQAVLASECGVSQMTVSKLLTADGNLARRTGRGWTAVDPRALAARFLAEYPGPGGLVQAWYSTAPITEQAQTAAKFGEHVLLSGDSAADRLAPWRIPRSAMISAPESLPLENDGFAETDSREATLRVSVPADRTIRSTAHAWYPGGGTVDPLVAAWDLRTSGGADAEDAAEHLLRREVPAWRD